MKDLTLRITGIRYADGELHIACSPAEGIRAAHAVEKDKQYDLRLHREKRSLDANAYCWVLINRIAEKIHEPPVVIYRRYIRDIGCRVHIVLVNISDLELETASFMAGHIGRMVSVEECVTNPDKVFLHKKYGSSNYDTRQMAAFIDAIVQDAQALGIETKDPNEIESLLNSWKTKP